MEPLVHLNGELVDIDVATISPLDRGFLFADAVYEGIGVLDGQIVDFEHHHRRLERCLGEVDITLARSKDEWWHLLMTLIEANDVDEGFVYLQVTRGADGTREYEYPEGLTPTVFAYAERNPGVGGADQPPVPLRLASYPDLRWARRDIKTTNLLGQVMAKQHAQRHGCDEALLVTAKGIVTECGARSFGIVVDGAIVTRPLSKKILPGVTRRSLLAAAHDLGLEIDERTVTLDEAKSADEAFASGASTYVQPVVAIDDATIGSGAPGPITLQVREHYLRAIRASFYRPD